MLFPTFSTNYFSVLSRILSISNLFFKLTAFKERAMRIIVVHEILVIAQEFIITEYSEMRRKFLFFIFLYAGCCGCQQLAVYWGQDPAGGLKMILEKRLDDYCMNYEYDIIPVAFLNIFFDWENKGKFQKSSELLRCLNVAAAAL